MIGQFEFSVVPRSFFASDGTMLHCSAKSALKTIIIKLGGESQRRTTTNLESLSQLPVAVVDAMVELQSLDSRRFQRLFTVG